MNRANTATRMDSRLICAKLTKVLVVGLGLVMCWGAQARADEQTKDLPTGKAIMEKFIEASGGRAAYEKLHNRESHAHTEMAAMGLKGTMVVYEAEPNKQYVIQQYEGMGQNLQGTDGEVAWSHSAMGGAVIMEGEQKDIAIQGAVFNADLKWKKLHKKVECVGTEDVDGKACYKVVMTPQAGPVRTIYFDKDSGLQVRMDIAMKSPMGEMTIETLIQDYKKVDGVLMPHKLIQKLPMAEQVLTIDSIKHNVDLSKDRFDPPAEVKALLEKQKQDKAKKPDTPAKDKEAGKQGE